jgi:glycosyltransferase involved in cell wall biosynthesis
MKRIALVENFGSDFYISRLRFALFLKENNFDVTAIIPNDGYVDKIRDKGIKVISFQSNIRGLSLSNKVKFALDLKKIFSENNFDLIHFYRLQPNIIGTFMAGIFTKAKIVNHVTGLGIAFSSSSFKNILLQTLTKCFYKFNYVLFNPYTIYQNKYDSRDLGIEKRTICIEGSSVNEDRYNLEHASTNKKYISSLVEELDLDKTAKTFLFVSRLIKEKGILELTESIININLNNTKVNLIIAGWSDLQNPSAIKTSYFKTLSEKYNFIKFLGKRSDVNDLIALSDVSILPTYLREGTPRFLLESMAMGKPIITTEMPGCDHLISNSKNGIMVKQKSVKEIEDSIIEILGKDIISMGQESYNFYKKKFSEKVVYSSIEKLYRSIL